MTNLDTLMDAQYYFAVFRHAIVKNSQTVFFHRPGDDVVMIAAGYSGRAWRRIMQGIEPHQAVYMLLANLSR